MGADLTINQVIKQFQDVFGDISYEAQKFGDAKVYAKGVVQDTSKMTAIIPVLQPKEKRVQLDANQLYHKLTTAGEEWADLQAAYNVLEDTKNAVLAKLMMKSQAPSVAAREIEAKASAEYTEHVKATQEAMKAALKAKVKYETMKTWVDLKRSEEATRRVEMKL